jgi:hypothetical protein
MDDPTKGSRPRLPSQPRPSAAPGRNLRGVAPEQDPVPEERLDDDDGVSHPLPPEEAVSAILATGQHPDEGDEDTPPPLEDRPGAAH